MIEDPGGAGAMAGLAGDAAYEVDDLGDMVAAVRHGSSGADD